MLRKPERDRTPAEQKQIAQWIAAGVLTQRTVSSRDPRAVVVEKSSPRSRESQDPNPEQNRIESVDPIGWDDTNWATADDAGNWVGRPPLSGEHKGAGNGNYTLTTPAVNLDGRGDLDINLNMYYNSRLWSKAGTEITYDADRGYPAPGWNLGFGKMFYMGQYGGCMLVAPDGTRRSYYAYSTGNSYYNSGGVINHAFNGFTTDGSLIDYTCNYYSNGSYSWFSGEARMPNGTRMTFGSPSASNDQTFPVRILDRHGNYIDITYQGNSGPAINDITDTLGRTIDFNYNGSGLLTSITGPGYNSTTRTFLRLEYSSMTLAYNFGTMTVNLAQSTPYMLISIFYPTTGTGYRFVDTDSYSPYGILRRVTAKRGMTWNGTYVDYTSTTSREEIYDFPTTTTATQSDSPGYSQHNETFDGIDTSTLTTTFSKSVNTGTGEETITVTRPDSSKLVEISNLSSGLLIKNRLTNSSNTILDETVTTLGTGGAGDYYSPRPTQIEHTDDKSQTKKTEFTYGTSVYNQVTAQKEYEYGGTTLYREKRFTYENGSNYTSNHVFSLVKSVEDYDGSNGRLTRTAYTYDGSSLVATSGIVQHDFHYDPDTTETQNGSCLIWNPDGEGCSFEGQTVYPPPNYFPTSCACDTWDQVSAYNWLTTYRGNLTNITTYDTVSSGSATGAISYDFTYDIAGNERTSTTNCCQQIGSSYSTATQYLYPDSVVKGSSNTSSPDRITQSFSYDSNTKLPTTITDFNGLSTTIAYDAVYRPTLVTLNSGGKKTTTYNDSSLNQNELVQLSNNTTVSNSTVYFNGRGQVNKSTYQAGSSNYNGVQVKYDNMGRQWKVSRPYDTGSSPSYWSETTYDLLGRPTLQKSPDTTTAATMTYNPSPTPTPATSNVGQTVTSADAWGRQRWTRYDAFGRLVEVVEPDPASSTGAVSGSGAITTTYAYDQLDRLTGITQGDQTRSFRYDSLGRLIYQKLPEQGAHIDADGVYNGTNTLLWSDKFEYDSRSNLKKRTDARGVVTTYEYNVSSSPDPLNRLQSISYSTSGADTTYTIHAAPTASFEYMTTGDKTRVKKVTTSGVATEENTFDGESRVSSYQLKLDAHTGKPFNIDYAYDSAHRLAEIEYPARYQMSYEGEAEIAPSYDQASRLTQLTVDGSTQLSDVSYNTSGQVTTLKTGAVTSYPRVESYSYDAATGLLTGQTVKNTALSTTYLDLSYSYDRGNSAGSGSTTGLVTGQMTKITNNMTDDRDRKYEFDALGRLKYAKGGTAAGATSSTANWTQEYTYDRYGNKTATATQSGSVDENNAAVPVDGLGSTSTSTSTNRITAFSYDRAGNIVRGQNASGVWQRFEYDAAGRLKKVQDDSYNDLETYKYGAGRQKLVMTNSSDTFYYVWGGSSIIAEYKLSGGNPMYLKSYIYAGSRLLVTYTRASAGTQTQESHHPDRLGTKLVTDQYAGSSFQQSTLPFGTAFGAESSGYSNQVFTSYDRSSGTGLDYANNRTYSSGQGRFTQVDPIGMASASIGNPQSNNMYSYTQNMPTDFVDPSGLQMIPFTRTVCLPWDGGPRICVEIVVHWMNVGSGSAPPNSIGGGGGGGTALPQQQPKKPKCKQGTDEQKTVIEKLGVAGLSGFIDPDSYENRREGVTFLITDRDGFLNAVSANPAFAGPTPFGLEHTDDVTTPYFKIKDFRSFTTGSNTLGSDGSGYVRSLQVDVGQARPSLDPTDRSKSSATGYADLDCDNPAQDVKSFFKHAFKVIFGR